MPPVSSKNVLAHEAEQDRQGAGCVFYSTSVWRTLCMQTCDTGTQLYKEQEIEHGKPVNHRDFSLPQACHLSTDILQLGGAIDV